jgi:type IV fimbrial biogenesis protein FimT
MTRKRERMAGPAGARGYTLTELTTVAALAATLGSFVVPSFSRLVQDTRRTDVINDLVGTFLFARIAAAADGQPVVVCGYHDANADGRLDPSESVCAGRDWSEGWFAASWNDRDADNVIAPGELTLRRVVGNASAGRIRVGAPAFGAAALPAGAAVIRPFPTRSSNGTLVVCNGRGSAHSRALVIAPSGRTRIADRKADGTPHACS